MRSEIEKNTRLAVRAENCQLPEKDSEGTRPREMGSARLLRICFVLTVGLFSICLSAGASDKRYALVVGCDYEGTDRFLPSPGIDARRFAEMLERNLGFAVDLKLNPSRKDLLGAMDRLGESLQASKGVGLFYFSGHGAQHEGENYLLPAGSHVKFQEDLQSEAVSAQMMVTRMEGAGNDLNLLFLDACRDLPLPSAQKKSSGAPSKGLQSMSGSGILVGFAAAAGAPAFDSGGGGSYYTNALLKHMLTPGLPILEVLTRVRKEVKQVVQEQEGEVQEPFILSGLDETLYLVGAPSKADVSIGPGVMVPSLPAPSLADQLRWASKDQPFENSLGMRFVPVPVPGTKGLLFSIWETRVSDFMSFVDSGSSIASSGAKVLTHADKGPLRFDGRSDLAFRSCGFPQGPDHPVVCVTPDIAKAFCEWLSNKEGLRYRLPSDAEWSAAAGLDESDNFLLTPSEKSSEFAVRGIESKPKGSDVGNLLGEEAFGKFMTASPQPTQMSPLEGHRDNFIFTAPVGTYPPNEFGLYDMFGNVKEITSSIFDPKSLGSDFVAVRGSSFRTNLFNEVSSAKRSTVAASQGFYEFGFRVVVESPSAR